MLANLEAPIPDRILNNWVMHVGEGVLLIEASATRSGDIAKKRLQSFNGLLQTDGYNGYKALRTRKGIVPCGCLTMPDVSSKRS